MDPKNVADLITFFAGVFIGMLAAFVFLFLKLELSSETTVGNHVVFVLNPAHTQEILLLMAESGIENPKDFLNNATAMMTWIIQQTKANRQIWSVNLEEGDVIVPEIGFITFMQKANASDN